MKRKHKKILSLIIALIVLFTYYIIEDYPNNEAYSNKSDIEVNKEVTTDVLIYFFDVGQADSIFITNNNYNMLIDAGNNEDGKKIVNYLKNELNISKIDYVIGTHPHEDHIGGLDDIIDNFSIKEVYLPEAMTTTKTFEEVLDSIANKELSITVPIIGETFKLGDAEFKVIYSGSNESDLNSSSIILRMQFGTKSYLFTGDTTEEIEKGILNSDINVDVLKVAHHGSKYSTSEEFLNKATPEYAIISVGNDNSYGHPEKETLERLKNYTNKIYATNELGTILITSDGNTISMKTLNTDTNG